MQAFTLWCIKIYQILVSPLWVVFPYCGCRFYPTCSQYMSWAVQKYGVVKGIKRGIWRVISCNPWNS